MSHASPSPDAQTPECLVLLGLRPPLTLEDVKQAYMAKAMKAHPDRGGDPQEFIRLQKAFDDANEYVKFKASKIEWLASKIDAYAQRIRVLSRTDRSEALRAIDSAGNPADDVPITSSCLCLR